MPPNNVLRTEIGYGIIQQDMTHPYKKTEPCRGKTVLRMDDVRGGKRKEIEYVYNFNEAAA